MKLYMRDGPLELGYYASTAEVTGMGAGNPRYFKTGGELAPQNPTYYDSLETLKEEITKAGHEPVDKTTE